MDNKTIIYSVISLFISGLLIAFGFTSKPLENPNEVYRVYLSGKSIGIIQSKKELEDYIDQEQTEIKEKYNVDKVYAPTNLDILKEVTYNEQLTSTKDIYEVIKKDSYFSIEGYKIIIDSYEEQHESEVVKKEQQTIYALDNKTFLNAVDIFTRSFLTEEEIKNYENETQKEIVDTGSLIESIYTEPNEFRVVKENIPVNEKIYTNEEDLGKYLLFGNNVSQEKYIIKEGDTIENVAFNNKMSVTEFLVLNTNFKTDKDLLYPGQEVVVGTLNPQFQVKTITQVVENQEIKYKTTVKYDNAYAIGFTKTEQTGKNGLTKVIKKINTANGETINSAISQTEEIVPSVEEIIIRGGRQGEGGPIGDVGIWSWPTKVPYSITSGYGYRWGKLHEGIDIQVGFRSPIYAANSGVVEISSYNGTNGNYIVLNHNNGYKSVYAHMHDRYAQTGQIVERGQVIGSMGSSGFTVGGSGGGAVHLHFGIYRGRAFTGIPVNPLRFY